MTLRNWTQVEARPRFIEWLTDQRTMSNGLVIRYAFETDVCGLKWVRYGFNGIEVVECERAGGCFYNNCDGHPEGALLWAKAAVQKHDARLAF